MIKIIYIAGDGRSGSTLLDSVLSNIENSISVGECHRFWIRYSEGASHCGCSNIVTECSLWSQIQSRLQTKFPDYEIAQFVQKVREIQFFRNFKQIPKLLQSEEWKTFGKIVVYFYASIAEITGKNVIIDSSKSVPWAYLLLELGVFDIRMIHLERDVLAVANSWKKKVMLPEYTTREVWMPVKGNWVIAKTWLKIKKMANYLVVRVPYMEIKYKSFCKHPENTLEELSVFLDESIPTTNLQLQKNHAIGGNPMRSQLGTIEIKNQKTVLTHLTFFDKFYFRMIKLISKVL